MHFGGVCEQLLHTLPDEVDAVADELGGRVDLMGDAGREPPDGFQPPARRQAYLGLLEIGDVCDCANEPDGTRRRDHGLGHESDRTRSCLGAIFEFHGPRPAAEVSPVALMSHAIVRMNRCGPIAVDALLWSQAESAPVLGVRVPDAPTVVGKVDGYRRPSEQRPSECSAFDSGHLAKMASLQ